MSNEFNPVFRDRLPASNDEVGDMDGQIVIPTTTESVRILEGMGRVLKVPDFKSLFYITSFLSRWSLAHANKGDELIGANPNTQRGMKITSPLIEKAKGSSEYEDWLKHRIDGRGFVDESNQAYATVDAVAARMLTEAEEMTGIKSLDLHFNHGVVFTSFALNCTGEGWFLGAYNREEERCSFLTGNILGGKLKDEQKVETVTQIKKWKNVLLPTTVI